MNQPTPATAPLAAAEASCPRPEPNCPLCGGPNGCAAVAAGRLDVPCWCQTATFSADLLARVPSERQGLACICARCAAAESAGRP